MFNFIIGQTEKVFYDHRPYTFTHIYGTIWFISAVTEILKTAEIIPDQHSPLNTKNLQELYAEVLELGHFTAVLENPLLYKDVTKESEKAFTQNQPAIPSSTISLTPHAT